VDLSGRVDETYIKVKGKWVYLYRAIDKYGETIDFYLSSRKHTNAARKFLTKSLKSIPKYPHPDIINTDKNPTYGKAILKLKEQKVNAQTI
jgi:IS6 family transposase